MCNIGIPVPPGFTISTLACKMYYQRKKLSYDKIKEYIVMIEDDIGRKFGDPSNPLLVSIRSGSVNSMPGMLDTILNVGLNDDTVVGLAQKSGQRFAYDSYCRFITMYSNIVLRLDHHLFQSVIDDAQRENRVKSLADLNVSTLKRIVHNLKDMVYKNTGKHFPQNVKEQLLSSADAVFASWKNDRAVSYRRIHNISEDLGTAVNVQAMVFGNLNNNSATGVIFTRNPSTGEKRCFGEFLVNAQGEDVVSGIYTPLPVNGASESTMEKLIPDVYRELCKVCEKLETHYRDMQDIEFTVQDGKLWILQTRLGKRTTESSITIMMDMVDEGIITKEEGHMELDSSQNHYSMHQMNYGFHTFYLPNSYLINETFGFAIEKVAITGNKFADQKDILSLIEKTQPIVYVRLSKLANNIKSVSKWIKDVRVYRILPNTLHIDIYEHKPFAIWKDNNKTSVVDSEGADFITVHLREDRRHIRDEDVYNLKNNINVELNLEIAATEEMLEIAKQVKPYSICIVPEKRGELTTEGGLDLAKLVHDDKPSNIIKNMHNFNIKVSLFLDPNIEQLRYIEKLKVKPDIIEIHSGDYCNDPSKEKLQLIATAARVRTAKGRKISSTRWLHRHLNDQCIRKTNKDGYRSRSAYKLVEIDKKFKLLQSGQKVIDLGAYPGGWSQVASHKTKDVIAIDLKLMEAINGVELITCDIINEFEALKEKLRDQKFDVILSDMAPGSCGLQSLDHIRIMLLCEAALNLAKHSLNDGGKFVVKIFQGGSDKDFYNKLKKMFKIVKYFKPQSSRSESAEIYLVSLDFNPEKVEEDIL
ncbi:Hypothetical protein CINCED_3A000279 [Cinara cedri]|nr:Hypothetical protein CINCED_3A000279 [Cinara cedri]